MSVNCPAADPSGSVSAAVTEAVRVVRESGLPNRTDSMFTTIEGDWDECMDVVKRACEAVGRYGSRVSLVLKADIRPGHTGELTGKVARVEAGLHEPDAAECGQPGPMPLDDERHGSGSACPAGPIRTGGRSSIRADWPSAASWSSRHSAFDTLEINGSFYSLQRPSSYLRWRDATPDGFVFAVKGSRYITHLKKLGDTDAGAGQLPGVRGARARPQARSDAVAAAADPAVPTRTDDRVLRSLPATAEQAAADRGAAATTGMKQRFRRGPGHRRRSGGAPMRHAVEVRHDSFATGDFAQLCREFGVALVVADTAGRFTWVDEVTSELVYVRLHGDQELYVSGYTDQGIDWWADRVAGLGRGPRGAARCRSTSTTTGRRTPRTTPGGWRERLGVAVPLPIAAAVLTWPASALRTGKGPPVSCDPGACDAAAESG